MPDHIFQCINDALHKLKNEPNFSHVRETINAIVSLLGIDVTDAQWNLFTDSNGKIASNAAWFNLADGYADRRATYALKIDASIHLDLKVYWLEEMNKSKMSWCVALTPNFEDFGMDLGDNVGIDFFVPQDCSRIVVVLSKNHVLRTLEVRNELSNTQKDIFALWHQQFDFSNKEMLHDTLWKSFDFEPVNKKFFKGISSFFTELVQHLSETVKIMDNRNASVYVNRLIGRMIFVWFLDKKGIINTQQAYFVPGSHNATTYYKDKLSVLFFRVLNTEVAERDKTDDRITPYLNGGLFEEREDDRAISHKDNIFPADYFDRFLAFLHHYNFTTDESSSDYQQTAIDPEMLGRIFENLLAEHNEETGESARKAKGAFYTPREIVDYMTKQTLIAYLKTQIKVHKDHEEYLERIVTARPHEWRDQQRNYRRDIKLYKSEIINALDRMTILDPACGSGAFPMGMMQLLVQTYERLESRFDAKRVKMQVIKNNLFGVDIEPMAVEIARLRAWLSIIVDEDNDSKDIKPLPNLDFKFITANSLLPLASEEGQQNMFDDRALKQKMQQIREEYFETGNKRTKEKLRKDFYRLSQGGQLSLHASQREHQLLSYDPFKITTVAEFFDPQFMFSVDDFDAVIGNPPYLRIQGLQKTQPEMIPLYKQEYESAKGSFDLYALFIERGMELLSESGDLAYIVPHKFFQATFGKHLRGIISRDNALRQIVKFGAEQVFENPTTYTCLLFLSSKPKNKFEFINVLSLENLGETMNHISEKREISSVQRGIISCPKGDKWDFHVGKEKEILDVLLRQKYKLDDIVEKIFQGIATSADKVYVLKALEEREKTVLLFSTSLEKEVEIEKGLLRPFLMGKDVHRYERPMHKNYVIFPYTICDNRANLMTLEYIENNFPLGYKYLLSRKEILMKREGGKFTKEWWCFSRPQNMTMYDKKKIMTPEIALGSQMTFDEAGFAHTTKVYSFIFKEELQENLKYWLGLLNSRLFWFFLSHTGYILRGGYFTFKTNYLLPFPVKRIDFDKETEKQMHDKIVDLVNKCLVSKKENNGTNINYLETEIDDLVYQLYGLTYEEIKIIQGK